MAERFTYESDLVRELERQHAVRFWLWWVGLGLFWGIGLQARVAFQDSTMLTVASSLTVGVPVVEAVLRKRERRLVGFTRQVVEFEDPWLRQKAHDGTMLGEIDLRAEYLVAPAFATPAGVIYRVSQQSDSGSVRQVEFGSHIRGRVRLLRQILRSEL